MKTITPKKQSRYNAAYYQKHQVEIKAKRKAYREANLEKTREANRKWAKNKNAGWEDCENRKNKWTLDEIEYIMQSTSSTKLKARTLKRSVESVKAKIRQERKK